MNKLTTTLAGLALVAGASIAPAFAQGDFTTNGPFTFSFAPSTFTVTNLMTSFNPFGGGATSTATISLFGGTEVDSTPDYKNVTLTFTPAGGTTSTDTLANVYVVSNGDGTFGIASPGRTAAGDSVNLQAGAPVPEASTVISFGALLALGGLAVLRRKSVAKNAA